MHSKNIILNSLKESTLLVKTNKKTFSLILILQLLFFLFIGMANAFYQPIILQHAMNIIEYMESLNLNADAAGIEMLKEKIPLGDDPLLISRNYNAILKNVAFLSISIFAIFALLNGLIWHFSSNMGNKNIFSIKNILAYLSRFVIASLILSFFFYLLAYNALKVFFSSFLSVEPMNFIPLLIIAVIAIYFVYIAIPILDKIKIKNLIKKTLLIGTKRFFAVLASYLIILISIVLLSLLLFYSIEKNLFLALVSLVLLILAFAWSKVFISIVITKSLPKVKSIEDGK
jgi:hypothetical protein|tara:strand:- start:26 stop:886 length:861 start_codon:yes stop_codon:yes gene_type:complete